MDVIGDAPQAPGPFVGLRRPGRRSRRVFGVVAVLGLLGYAVTHRYPSPPPAVATPVPAPAAEAGVLTGRPGFGPTGLRVVLTGTPLRVVDLHTGRQQEVTGLPPGAVEGGADAEPVRGGLIVYASGLGSVESYLVRPGRPTRRVARNGIALPSWDGRSLIVMAIPQGTEQYAVTGQTLDGQRQWQWLAANHALVLRDTRAGLLVQDTDPPPEPQRLRLVRRQTGEVLRQLRGTTIAVGGEAVAYLRPGCGGHCALQLSQVATGATRLYPLPVEPATGGGTFSPDGRWLAMTAPAGPAAGVPPSRSRGLTVLDLRTGTVAPVLGLSIPPGEPPTYAWSGDGRSLVVAVREGDAVRLGIWQPGSPGKPMTVLPVTYPADRLTGVIALP